MCMYMYLNDGSKFNENLYSLSLSLSLSAMKRYVLYLLEKYLKSIDDGFVWMVYCESKRDVGFLGWRETHIF